MDEEKKIDKEPMKNNKYIVHERNLIDRCNICGKISQLTWDHVPPQSALLAADTYASTIMGTFPTPKKYMRHYQSGIQYRSICQNCNNVLLGKYDGLYKEFVFQIAENLKYIGRGPLSTIKVHIKVNRILRIICGHFLSMRSVYAEEVVPESDMRKFILNDRKKPKHFKIYSWIHPYDAIVNARDILSPGFIKGTHPQDFISVMSSFPISFLLATTDESICDLDDLSRYATSNIDEDIEIKLHISTAFYPNTNILKDPLWPIDVSHNPYGAIATFGGREMVEGSRIGTLKNSS